MNEMRDRLVAFLRDHQVLTLAVAGNDGAPYAAALFYAVDDELNFYVVSDPGTVHGRAMLNDGRVAGTVQRDRQSWQEAAGVQFTGRCRRLTGAERVRGWAVFMGRFGFLREVKLAGIGELAAALAKIDLWRIEPSWIRLIENKRGFGHKEEWTRQRA
jgi:hypothetical protein